MSKQGKSSLRVSSAETQPKLIILSGLGIDSLSGVVHDYSKAADGYIAIITRSPDECRKTQKLIQQKLGIEPVNTLTLNQQFGKLHNVNELIYPASELPFITRLGADYLDVYELGTMGAQEKLRAFLSRSSQSKGKH